MALTAVIRWSRTESDIPLKIPFMKTIETSMKIIKTSLLLLGLFFPSAWVAGAPTVQWERSGEPPKVLVADGLIQSAYWEDKNADYFEIRIERRLQQFGEIATKELVD